MSDSFYTQEMLEAMTVAKLIPIAKEMGVEGYSSKTKKDLIQAMLDVQGGSL